MMLGIEEGRMTLESLETPEASVPQYLGSSEPQSLSASGPRCLGASNPRNVNIDASALWGLGPSVPRSLRTLEASVVANWSLR